MDKTSVADGIKSGGPAGRRLFCKVNVVVDMITAEAVIARTAGAVAEFKAGVLGVGTAADGAFVPVETASILLPDFAGGLPEVHCRAGGLPRQIAEQG